MSRNLLNSPYDDANPIQIDLQLSLLNTWTKFNVPDYYQNICLAYVEELEQKKA